MGDTSHCLKRALARALVERRERVSSGEMVSAVDGGAAAAEDGAAAAECGAATGGSVRSVRTWRGATAGAGSDFLRGGSIESSVR